MKNLNIRECINWLDRSQIQEFLERNGMAVYDYESIEELKDTLYQCIEAGDIPENDIKDLVL